MGRTSARRRRALGLALTPAAAERPWAKRGAAREERDGDWDGKRLAMGVGVWEVEQKGLAAEAMVVGVGLVGGLRGGGARGFRGRWRRLWLN